MQEFEGTSVKKSKAPLYVSIGVVLVVILIYFLVPEAQHQMNTAWDVLTGGDEKKTHQWVSQFGYYGPFVIVAAMILQMFLIVVPTPILMVVTIIAYGPLWGSLILLSAIFLASTTGYIIGRYFGPVFVDKLIGRKNERKISSFIEDYGFWTVIVIRLSPFLSNDAISFVGGVLKMGYWRFIGATMIGISPLIFFIAYLGADFQRLKSGLIWASFICLLLFFVFVWWDKSRKKRSK